MADKYPAGSVPIVPPREPFAPAQQVATLDGREPAGVRRGRRGLRQPEPAADATLDLPAELFRTGREPGGGHFAPRPAGVG
ncbi:hypothetical protein AB0F52_22075 [Amycolatopsis sp. NPDC024027]|uniref:hypothetical protein n=1 Tax=Amycolatopsis sp. NPDC024027 TaxID=3154327 RepID=UPI00340D6C3B